MQKIWEEKSASAAMKYISQYITEDEANVFLRNKYVGYKTNFETEKNLCSTVDYAQ